MKHVAKDHHPQMHTHPPQARALFEVPDSAPHLLPFYARVAATLAQVFPDVAAPLLRYLEEEFAALQARRHPILYSRVSC